MTSSLLTSIMAARPLAPAGDGAAAPDWVHLLPAGDGILTHDGRGPYRAPDLAALMATSLKAGEPLLIDQDHATDLAAPKGEPAPARGWIVELQARDDGLWGRVEWTAEGRALVEGKAYRGLSPVFLHTPDNQVMRLLRASLTNVPNLRGLTALHSQGQDMDHLTKIAAALGLPATATLEEILAKIANMGEPPALQSALTEIGAALGVSADPAAIVAAAQVARAGTGQVAALQSQVTSLRSELDALTSAQARTASEAYVDAEMAKGRVGLNATTRGTLVSLHMAQPADAVKLIEAMPIVGPAAAAPRRASPTGPDGRIALNAEQIAAAAALGVSQADYAKTLTSEETA